MSISAAASAIGGGVAGSALTYGLTWFREQRRTLDAYRAPQRRAIGGIIAATNEIALSANDWTDAIEAVRERETRQRIGSAMDAMKRFIAAKLNPDRAFQTGRLAVVDAECHEAMVVAYNEFAQLADVFKHHPAADDDDEQQDDSVYEHLLGEIERYSRQLVDHIDDLVQIGHQRLTPKQSVWNKRKRAQVRKRLEAKYFDK